MATSERSSQRSFQRRSPSTEAKVGECSSWYCHSAAMSAGSSLEGSLACDPGGRGGVAHESAHASAPSKKKRTVMVSFIPLSKENTSSLKSRGPLGGHAERPLECEPRARHRAFVEQAPDQGYAMRHSPRR